MKTLALKVLGFFAFVFAVFRWGSAEAKLKQAKKVADEAIKNSRDFEIINSEPYVENPADFLCDNEPSMPGISEDDNGACKKAE